VKKDATQELRDVVDALCVKIGPRAPGSAAERQAATYLAEKFKSLDLPTVIEPFASGSHEALRAELVSASGKSFPCLPTQFSPPGKASGELFFLPGFEASHAVRSTPNGRVALILPSSDHAGRLKSLINLQRRGLQAAIIVSTHIDHIDTQLVRCPELRIPVVTLSFRTACELRRLVGTAVTLHVVSARARAAGSCNVLATIRGQTRYWLTVSSHFDTAAGSAGAVDNAAGTAVVLELARRLKATRPRASIVFVLTGSAEYGDAHGCGRGALAFYQRRISELHECVGHVDTDGLGSLLAVPQIHISGPRPFREAAGESAFERKYAMHGPANARGDHGSAQQHGIPYIWFTDLGTGNHPHIHTPEDTIDFLDFAQLAGYVPDIEQTIRRLSRCQPVFPFLREGEVLLRPARGSDIPAILDITTHACGPVAIPHIQQKFFGAKLGGRDWHDHTNQAVERHCQENILQTVVAEHGHTVVGYATYVLERDTGIAAIGSHAVHPKYQRRGIGSRLQKEVNRRMAEEGFHRFSAEARSGDKATQHLYEKLGYTRVAGNIHYLRRGPGG
jgi:ribosomal protein S18 acetylase RimI-like enzyme